MERLLRIASPLGLYAEGRCRHRPSTSKLPAGVLASGVDRGRRAPDPHGTAGGVESVSDPFDVIVIGSGTGAAPRPPARPLGQADPLAGARWLAPSRAANWLYGDASSTIAASRPRPGTTATAKHFSPRSTTASAARRSSSAPAPLPAASRGLRRAPPPRSRLPSMADLLRRDEALRRAGGTALPGPGGPGEDPTEPAGERPYPFPAVFHEPRIQQLADDLAPRGYHPFSAIQDDARRRNMPSAPACGARVRQLSCLVHAKSDAEVVAVRRRSSTRMSPCYRREGGLARDERGGHHRHRGRRRAGGRDGGGTPATSSSLPRRGQLGEAAPLRRTTSIRTASPTAPTRSVTTSCFTTHGPYWRSPRKRIRRCFRRLSG